MIKLKYTPYYSALQRTGNRMGHIALVLALASLIVQIISWFTDPLLSAISILLLFPAFILGAIFFGVDYADSTIYKSQPKETKGTP